MPITQKTFDFLLENRINDSRTWFHEHKAAYIELVEEPLLALATFLTPVIEEIDPLAVKPPKRTISRVWRDTRFIKGGSIFREVMWLAWGRAMGMEYPGLYFELFPGGCRYGCGYYHTYPKVALAVQQMVLKGDIRYTAAKKAMATHPELHFQGEKYKRPRYKDAPEADREWLERKELVVGHEGGLDLLFADNLDEILADAFRSMAPIYHLLLDAHLSVLDELPKRQS